MAAADSPAIATSPGPALPDRPWITLAWAQSIDGCIAARRDARHRISGPESSRLTHELRARHAAVLVGAGTVAADDPRLSVRLAEGPNPLPVVLDGRLRVGLDSWPVREASPRPWILASEGADAARRAQLESRGCRVIEAGSGGRVDLRRALAALLGAGISSLMVEGGGEVLLSFLGERLADRIVLTLGPRWLGGYNPFALQAGAGGRGSLPPFSLGSAQSWMLGGDIVIEGIPEWSPRWVAAPDSGK